MTDADVVQEVSIAHRRGNPVSAELLNGNTLKFQIKLEEVQTVAIGERTCYAVRGNVKKYSQPKARCIADKYEMQILFMTFDASWLKKPKDRRFTIEGVSAELAFDPEKLNEPDLVNFTSMVVYDNEYAEVAKAHEAANRRRAAFEEKMKDKVCLVIIKNASITRYGIDISGSVFLAKTNETRSLSVKFGIYSGAAQTDSTSAFIADFHGDLWAFTTSSLRGGDSYKFLGIDINHREVPKDKVVVVSREEFKEYMEP